VSDSVDSAGLLVDVFFLLQAAAAVSAAVGKGVNSLDIPRSVLSPCSPDTPMRLGSVDQPGKTVTLADA
jgi:hypothetical protein